MVFLLQAQARSNHCSFQLVKRISNLYVCFDRIHHLFRLCNATLLNAINLLGVVSMVTIQVQSLWVHSGGGHSRDQCSGRKNTHLQVCLGPSQPAVFLHAFLWPYRLHQLCCPAWNMTEHFDEGNFSYCLLSRWQTKRADEAYNGPPQGNAQHQPSP